METYLILSFVTLTLFFFVFTNRKKKHPRYPPGPKGLPLIGNLHQFGKAPHLTLSKWAREYGPIYSIKMATTDAIILNEPKTIQELFSQYSSSGRTNNPILETFGGGTGGIINAEGPDWEAQRRFTIRILKEFGLSRTSIEGMILEEVKSMLNYFERLTGKVSSGDRIFNGAVINALWNIVSGERSEWDAPVQPEILHKAGAVTGAINRVATSGLYFAPFLRYIAPDYFGWTQYVKAMNDLPDLIKRTVKKHVATRVPNNPRDFIDQYLEEIENTTDPTSSFYNENGHKNLVAVVFDLFFAGSETTSATLSWVLVYLSENPTVQKKMQQELDKVIESSRLPTLSDRASLPYSEAVVYETIRMASVAAVTGPHRMTTDTMFNGYFFPNNCCVMANLYGAHHDPDLWNDPDRFLPERFLNEDGTKVVNHESLVAFSTGKRVCIGQQLATDTVFLFATSLCKKFSIEPDPNGEEQTFNREPGFMLVPKPFKIIVNKRS